jgi:hypothetical protein
MASRDITVQVQFRRRFGGWSNFTPLEGYLSKHWIYAEEEMRQLLCDPNRCRYVDEDGMALRQELVTQAVDQIEEQLFNQLSDATSAQAYLARNPTGRFRERATKMTQPPQRILRGSWHAFISHSGHDSEVARAVVARLRDDNLLAWIDAEQILPGDNISEKIEDGLQRSRWVIVCVSRHLKNSGWCRREYGPALTREIANKETRVIPLLIDQEAQRDDFPELLIDKHYVTFNDRTGWQRLINRLRESALTPSQ